MRIWMSEKSKQNNHYAARVVLPVVGGVLFALAIIMAVTFAALHMGWSVQIVSSIMCIFITVMLILLALNVSRISNRDALIFCKDDRDNLYAVDLRQFVKYQRGLGGYIGMAADIGWIQKKMKEDHTLEEDMEDGSIIKYAPTIVSVENMKVKTDGYAVVCRVHHPKGNIGKITYMIQHGYDQDDELIAALELRKHRNASVEMKRNPYPVRILISALAFIVIAVLCVLSHPACGILPQDIYFPCLGITTIPLIAMVTFIIKQSRGE